MMCFLFRDNCNRSSVATKTFQVQESIQQNTVDDILDTLSTVDSEVTSLSDAVASDTLTQVSDVTTPGHDVDLPLFFEVKI